MEEEQKTESSAVAPDELDCTVAIKEPVRQTYTELDARDATPPSRFE